MPDHDDKNPGGEQFREMTQNIFDSLRDLVRKSADEVVAGAKVTRSRIDIFQLRRDRDHFLMRLGQSAYTLLSEGGVTHPDLEQAYQRVRTIEEKIAEYEREITYTGMEAEAEAFDPEPIVEEPPAEEPKPKKTAAKKAAKKATKKTDKKAAKTTDKKAAKKPAKKKTSKKTGKKADKKAEKKVKKPAKKTAAKKPAKKKTDKKTGGKSKKTL